MKFSILSLNEIVVKSLIAMGFLPKMYNKFLCMKVHFLNLNEPFHIISLFFNFHFTSTSISARNNPNSKVLMKLSFFIHRKMNKRIKEFKLMNVNEKLTHIKLLITIQSLFFSNNIPDTCKPMSDERKAHLLN